MYYRGACRTWKHHKLPRAAHDGPPWRTRRRRRRQRCVGVAPSCLRLCLLRLAHGGTPHRDLKFEFHKLLLAGWVVCGWEDG